MRRHTGSAGVNHMRLNEINYTDALPIDGYGPGFFVSVVRSITVQSCVRVQGSSNGAGTVILKRC